MPFFAILTLFPDALEPYCRTGILGLAREQGLVRVLLVDFRDFARDRHRTVDDRPFGGGPGMVLRPEPIVDCVEWLERRYGTFKKLALCPTGRRFSQPMAEELALDERGAAALRALRGLRRAHLRRARLRTRVARRLRAGGR